MSRDLFGLKDEPFSAYPDNKYFFSSILHDKAITLLEYGLNSRKGFMLLTGLKGTGKTMTCNILKDSVRDCNVSMIKYGSVSSDVLMTQICAGFGLDFPETDKQELFGKVMEYFVDEYKDGKNNLIIIDEAETISDENLQLLSSFLEIEIEKCKLVQVIISGCPELHDRLKHISSELGPKFTFTVELAPLSLQDTIEYVEHRLKTAVGDEEVHLFKSNSYSEIYRYSKGVPSEINRIAHKALSIAKEKKQNKVTPGYIRIAAARLYGVKAARKAKKMPTALILIILLAAAGGYYYKDMLTGSAEPDIQIQQGVDVAETAKEVQEETEEKPEIPPAPVEIQENEEEAAQQVTSSVPEPENQSEPADDTVQKQAEEIPAEPESVPEEKPAAAEPEKTAVAVKHGCITAQSGLKIRAGASVDSELIGTAPYMEYIELTELSSDGNWWKTMYNGSSGYMYARYIRVVDSPEECVAE